MPYGQPWMQAGRSVQVDSTLDIQVDPTLAAGSVSASELASDAVTTVKILNDNVTTAKIADANVTTAKLADDAVTSAKIDEGVLQTATVSLTAAQIKALLATPIELVAAPGASKYIHFESAAMELVAGSEVFAEDGGGSNLGIKFTNGSGVQVSEDIESTGFVDQAANTISNTVAKKDAIVVSTGAANQALVLHNIGAGEITGNASNDGTLSVTVAYRVLATA